MACTYIFPGSLQKFDNLVNSGQVWLEGVKDGIDSTTFAGIESSTPDICYSSQEEIISTLVN